MSFALSEGTDELRRACNDAAERGIVLLCSTNDEGRAVSTTYPASYSSTITITACDDYGNVLRPGPLNDTGSFQYKVQGLSVAAGIVPFLDSDDRISGSSVATAITAGLSSLILSCDRIARDCPEKDRSESNHPRSFEYASQTAFKNKIIKKHLKEMLAEESKDYILLENFGGIDKRIRDGRDIEASDIITSYFRQSKFEEE